MGCFDTVAINCPKCGEGQDIQSKGGLCSLSYYESLAATPSDVLSDINRHAPFTCEKCGCRFDVKVTTVAYTKET